MVNENKLMVTNTRVKKYKKYRRSISNDFTTYSKKNRKNDDIKQLEKMISKVDKNLLMNNKNNDVFFDDFKNTWTHGDVTIVPAKNYLENIRNCNFTELLNKASSVKNDVEFEPHFDSNGNISNFWLDDDSKYSTLVELNEWIRSMMENKEIIINNAKDKIFIFKDAFYKSTNSETINGILPKKISFKPTKVNKKNKKIYYLLFILFFVFILFSSIFLILFFVY